MASVNQMIDAAEESGFVRTECHHDTPQHIVFDYPAPLRDGQATPLWRVHTDMSKVPHVTYIGGTGVRAHQASLVKAIAFMSEIAEQHPREGS